MLRTNAALIALMCLLAIPSGALAQDTSDSLIAADQIKAEKANYVTHTVTRGNYARGMSATAVEYYPHTYTLRVEVEGAKFQKYLVSRGDEVKAGDPLVAFSLDTDEVALESQRLTLARTTERFKTGQQERREAIDALSRELLQEQDRLCREILSLRIERAELELEQYIHVQNHEIALLEARVNELEALKDANLLLAPVDGVITDVEYRRTGDRVQVGEALLTLCRTDPMLLRIDNTSGYFRYGMDVVVKVGVSKSRKELTGRVVASDTLLSDSQRTGRAFIELDTYEEGQRLINPTVEGNTYYLENVICIPRRAAPLESGKYYVNKLVDGMVQKRYVHYIMNNISDAWILQGLTEGETLIID